MQHEEAINRQENAVRDVARQCSDAIKALKKKLKPAERGCCSDPEGVPREG
jgi:hypothetical protein